MSPRHSWWIASVADLVTLTVIRQDIDAVYAASVEDAHEQIAARNPLKPAEIFAVQRIVGKGSPSLARSIRDLRTKTIVCFENLIENACR